MSLKLSMMFTFSLLIAVAAASACGGPEPSPNISAELQTPDQEGQVGFQQAALCDATSCSEACQNDGWDRGRCGLDGVCRCYNPPGGGGGGGGPGGGEICHIHWNDGWGEWHCHAI